MTRWKMLWKLGYRRGVTTLLYKNSFHDCKSALILMVIIPGNIVMYIYKYLSFFLNRCIFRSLPSSIWLTFYHFGPCCNWPEITNLINPSVLLLQQPFFQLPFLLDYIIPDTFHSGDPSCSPIIQLSVESNLLYCCNLSSIFVLPVAYTLNNCHVEHFLFFFITFLFHKIKFNILLDLGPPTTQFCPCTNINPVPLLALNKGSFFSSNFHQYI